MGNLQKLLECGQSYWLDNLTRKKITSGELKKRVQEQGLRGVTSNPSIFHKAIAESKDYDEQIATLAGSPEQVYEKLVIKDIQDACDILRSVFDQSKGIDGFVSLEVSPHLANDTQRTIDEARRLYKEVNRPNCYIKIPGTKAGFPAIEQMLYEGVNINITLLFAVSFYEEVAQCYIRALERRVKENKPVDKIVSVASFFLSRIDVMVDPKVGKDLQGKTAVANAKIAYQSFKRIFSGDRWQALVAKGARVQRPLWASTSTKNPNYSDVMYIEPLIGKDTVNTMPEVTITAFEEHGKIVPNSIEQNVDEAKQTLAKLKAAGVDLQDVTEVRLVEEGIKKFNEPYDSLMKTLSQKLAAKKQ